MFIEFHDSETTDLAQRTHTNMAGGRLGTTYSYRDMELFLQDQSFLRAFCIVRNSVQVIYGKSKRNGSMFYVGLHENWSDEQRLPMLYQGTTGIACKTIDSIEEQRGTQQDWAVEVFKDSRIICAIVLQRRVHRVYSAWEHRDGEIILTARAPGV